MLYSHLLFACLSTSGYHAPAARVIHVAPRNAAGANLAAKGDGSPLRPLTDLQTAVDLAQPGDEIRLEPGRYTLQRAIELKSKNPERRPVTLGGPAAGGVILDGAQLPYDGTLGPNGDIFTVTGSGYVIRNLELRNARRIAINLWGGSHITLEGLTIRDSYRGATFMGNGASHLAVRGCDVFHNCRVNERRDIDGAAGWPSAVNLGDHSSAVGNRVYENWGEGIGFYGRSPLAARNVVRDNYSVNIYACNVEGGTIERNFVTTTRDPRFFRDLYGVKGPAFGIGIANEGAAPPFTRGFTIRNNVVEGGIFTLFWWSFKKIGGLQEIQIVHNTFVGGESATVRIESGDHRGTSIANNIFVNPDGALMPEWNLAPSAGGVVFRNNLWHGRDLAPRAVDDTSRRGDPRFAGGPVEKGAARFRLASDSPARGTARPLGAGREVVDDFDGRTRARPSDLGAFQNPL